MEKSSQPLAYILIQTARAVAEAGSPVGGAKKLGVSVTTVYRHLEALERSLGVQVFDRHHTGWQIRQDASILLTASKEIERILWQTRNDIHEAAGIRSGNLRITISENLASHYLVPLFDDFCRINNGIQPDLIIGSDFADLVQGEADVAIRPHKEPGDILVGRRVCSMTHAFYASRKFAKSLVIKASQMKRGFRAFDENSDGKVTREEFNSPLLERLASADVNKDGKITKDEMPGFGGKHGGSHGGPGQGGMWR